MVEFLRNELVSVAFLPAMSPPKLVPPWVRLIKFRVVRFCLSI